MDLQLQGKLALVTGGSAGIGRAVARLLNAEGCRVAVVGRDEARLAALRAEPGMEDTLTFRADLSEPEAAARVADDLFTHAGVPDILVNSVGAAQGGLFWELDDQVWTDAFNLKFMGTVRMLRAILPHMVARGSGNVVTIVGNNGRQPGPRLLPGSSANAALLALTKGLADEVAAKGVVVNAVNPGPTRTGRWNGLMAKAAADSGRSVADVEAGHVAAIPRGVLSEPEEIARYVVFLCSPLATAALGTSLTIDGGATRALA